MISNSSSAACKLSGSGRQNATGHSPERTRPRPLAVRRDDEVHLRKYRTARCHRASLTLKSLPHRTEVSVGSTGYVGKDQNLARFFLFVGLHPARSVLVCYISFRIAWRVALSGSRLHNSSSRDLRLQSWATPSARVRKSGRISLPGGVSVAPNADVTSSRYRSAPAHRLCSGTRGVLSHRRSAARLRSGGPRKPPSVGTLRCRLNPGKQD